MNFIKRNHRVVFFTSWILINLWQAATTQLLDDEAYYWIYSRFPAWGYFDHPPMIAWLIRAGTLLFPGEIGVRFFIVLLNTATVLVIEKLLTRKDPWLFYAICAAMAVVQLGGIVAVPDLPLMFFIAVYFLVLRRFFDRMSIGRSIVLGISIALMMYSKYHGVLLVLFTLLSNPRLLLRYQTYIAAFVAVLLFLPHINWQLVHDLPSVQYHLFERNASSYRISFTAEYLAGQVLLCGPLIGWLLLYSASVYKPATPVERAMKWSLAGIYIFFLLSSLKGRVEANWTIPAFVPLIVLSHQQLISQLNQRRWIFRLLPYSLVLIFAVRLFYAADLPRSNKFSKDEVHGNSEWIGAIMSRVGNQNLVVLNSYQTPSKYFFYTGRQALGLNTPEYRRNNFNFWPIERGFIGKPALVTGRFDSTYLVDRFTTQYLRASGSMSVPFFYSLSAIQLKQVHATQTTNGIVIKFQSYVPATYLPLLQQSPIDSAQVYVAVIRKQMPVQYIPTGFRVSDLKEIQEERTLSINGEIAGPYQTLKLAISTVIPGRPSVNSTGFKIK